MKFQLINLDRSASLKAATHETSGNMEQPTNTVMLMANAGTEPKELELQLGQVIILTCEPDMTLEGNNVIINPDSQQNMTIKQRVDVAPVDQKPGVETVIPTGSEAGKPVQPVTSQTPGQQPTPAPTTGVANTATGGVAGTAAPSGTSIGKN